MSRIHPVPEHRRQSSVWVPPTGPLHNPVEIFKGRSSRVKGSRVVHPNHLLDLPRNDLPNYKNFSDNSITTTKYNVLTFVPLNIFHQLKTRYANLYFFFIAALNFIPQLNAYSKWLALIPPMFVIGTTMLKDGYEDFRRGRSDKEINERLVHVWDRGRQMFRKTKWQCIIVGDIVHVSNDQDIPADLILLRSSDENGTCFIETSNLDGETSLKQRHAPRRYLQFSGEESGFKPTDFHHAVFCEKPDKAIYTVRANIEYAPDMFDAITKENMLLRGCRLKNTTFIEGYVLYTGHDTKVMMNNGRAPHKVSDIERLTNRFIIVCLVMLFAMVASGALLAAFFLDRHDNPFAPYIPTNSPSAAVDGVYSIGSFIICYQVLVPISLYITVEIIKLGQLYFISQDIDLYDEESDYAINCRSLNIPEELGQITHVLSDKTGTLTENKMIFRNCAVDETDYGGEFDPALLDPIRPVVSPSLAARVHQDWRKDSILRHFFLNILVNNSVVVNKTPHHDAIEVGTFQGGVYTIGNTAFYDVSMEEFLGKVQDLKNDPIPTTRFEMRADSFVSTDEEEDSVPSIPPTRADSPTDSNPVSAVVSRVSSVSKNLAHVVRKNILVPISSGVKTILSPTSFDAFKKFDFPETFCPYEAESPDELALIQGSDLYNFKLLDRTGTHVTILRPDGSNKRIPIRLVLPFDSKRKRMSVVVENGKNLILYTKGADSAVMTRIVDNSSRHSTALHAHLHSYSCRGLRTLCFAMKRMTAEEFESLQDSYAQVMMDTTQERENMLSDLADKVENNLTLLGVTGIEDRLQDGVETTIVSMREAGIQVWVLTGDKLETAENIARSCGLFSERTPLLRITKPEDVIDVQTKGYSVVLSTKALQLMHDGNETMIRLLERSSSVLCYRMTPSEKASVVKAVQKHLKAKVLAIGDGANDVPMIQAAHVGIGIKGKEGMQAVMACDYAIPRFQFLRKLLLVHGHWCYDRLALSFLYFLYKNTNSVFILFFYQFFEGYSGGFTIDPTYSVLYPIIFTSLQPIVVGVLDQDKSAEQLLNKPEFYGPGRLGSLYTYKLFFINVLDGIWQAAIIYFFCHLTLWETETGVWTLGFYICTGMMLVNNAHLAIEVRYWTLWLTAIFIFFIFLHFSYFSLYYGVLAQPGLIPDTPVDVVSEAVEDSRFSGCMIIMVIVSLLPRFLLRVASNSGLF